MTILMSLVTRTSSALAAPVSSTTANGETWGYGVCISAEPVIVTPTGGVPGYTYSWSRVSGSTAITALSSTSYSTYFQGLVSVGSTDTAVFKCTVTDSASNTVDTVNVNVSLTCNYSGGGIIP